MPETSDQKPEPPEQEGISLRELSQAYAQAMAVDHEPGTAPGEEPQPPSVPDQPEVDFSAAAEGDFPEAPTDEAPGDDSCELCPRTILEAMLFVGNRENEPLTSARAAELMRGVEPAEIPELVDQLNRRYDSSGCPYRIVSEGAGYRLTLRKAFDRVRNKFYRRVREARLSQAAIDVLAIVAYRQPLTSEQISRLRGTPSSHVLAQLVRRQLLRIERPPGKRRPVRYHTTDRFLELFRLEDLSEMPQAEEADQP